MKSPYGVVTLIGEDLRYDKFHSDSLIITGRFNRDSLLIEHLYADLNGTSFQGSGWQSVNLDLTSLDTLFTSRPLELNLHSQDNNLEFIGYLTDQVERIRGPFEIDVWLTGSLAYPSLSRGRIKLRDGVLELSRVRNPLTNVKIDAEIENSILTFQTFSAEAAKKKDLWESSIALISRVIRLFGGKTKAEGVVDLQGRIDLSDILHPRMDLGLDMYKLYIDYFVENTNMVLTSSDLKISGRDTLMVDGSIEVDEGLYVVDIAKLQKNIYLTQARVEKGRTLAWNMDIALPGNFVIRSSKLDLINNFQFEISGDVRTIQEPYADNMELTGYMDIISGKYGSWGQDFEIQSGNINFTDPNQINPEVNIRAEKRSRGYTFELSITGNLEKQQISLQVKDEDNNYLNYSDSDKLTLLTLGTMTSQLQAADLATAGGDVITTSVETAFSRGAESITGLDKVELDLKANVIDLQSLKLNDGLEDASISFGKYLTSNLYLEYRSKLGEGTIPVPKLNWVPGNQIFLEYRFNKNWSIDSFYQQTQRGNNKIKLSLAWKTTF
jgi:autotransporter translocation and assembly factor TamB